MQPLPLYTEAQGFRQGGQAEAELTTRYGHGPMGRWNVANGRQD